MSRLFLFGLFFGCQSSLSKVVQEFKKKKKKTDLLRLVMSHCVALGPSGPFQRSNAFFLSCALGLRRFWHKRAGKL